MQFLHGLHGWDSSGAGNDDDVCDFDHNFTDFATISLS